MPSPFSLTPLRQFIPPVGVHVPSYEDLAEAERIRQEKERERRERETMRRVAEDNAEAAKALQQNAPQPAKLDLRSMEPRIPQRQLPLAPAPREGIARFFLGDRSLEPNTGSARGDYAQLLRQGPGREGFLLRLGRAFAPGITEAVTDTYEEKLERARQAAQMEQDQEALATRARFADMGYYQSDQATRRAEMANEAKERVANINSDAKNQAEVIRLLGRSLGANGRIVSSAEAELLKDDPTVNVTRMPNGAYFAYTTKKQLQQEQFETLQEPTIKARGEQDRETESVRAANRIEVEKERGKQARLTKATLGADGASTTNDRRIADAKASDYLMAAGNDKKKAIAMAEADRKAGKITSLELAFIRKYIGNPPKEDDDMSWLGLSDTEDNQPANDDDAVIRATVTQPGKVYTFSDGSKWKLVNGVPTKVN